MLSLLLSRARKPSVDHDDYSMEFRFVNLGCLYTDATLKPRSRKSFRQFPLPLREGGFSLVAILSVAKNPPMFHPEFISSLDPSVASLSQDDKGEGLHQDDTGEGLPQDDMKIGAPLGLHKGECLKHRTFWIFILSGIQAFELKV